MRQVFAALALCVLGAGSAHAQSTPTTNYKYSDWVRVDDWFVTGHNLKSGSKWFLLLTSGGQFMFDYSDGTKTSGRYRARNKSICFTFKNVRQEICRTPKYLNGRYVWYQEENRSYTSELVSVQLSREIETAIAARQNRPRVCRDIASFCTWLSIEASACGWVTQGSIEYALGTDTGSGGSAVSGAACTAALSELQGLNVDIVDLILAATSSAAMSEAEESFSKGEFSDAIGLGLIGLGIGAISSAKCQATLERACR